MRNPIHKRLENVESWQHLTFGMLMRTHGTELCPVLSNDRTEQAEKDLSVFLEI